MRDFFYIDRVFDDFEAFADNARLWNVQMTQLSTGKAINTLKQLSLGKAKLNYLLFNGHKTTVGDPPPGHTFAIYSSGVDSKLVWRKKKVMKNDLMIFPLGAEHDVMTKGENIHVFTVTLPEAVWSKSLSEKESEMYDKQISSQETMNLSDGEMIRLRLSLSKIFQIIEKAPQVLNQDSFRKRIEEQTFHAITRALFSAQHNNSLQPARNTMKRAWDKIELVIKKNGNSLLPINELSQAVGVSERSLRRLFHDRYCLSPKNYLKRIRLNEVRSELKKLSEHETKVADVANRWGFWHMGQFAADYKLLFGELPSSTLRKNRLLEG